MSEKETQTELIDHNNLAVEKYETWNLARN